MDLARSWPVRLAKLQARRPWIPLLVCGVITLWLALVAARLELKTQFDQLLPQTEPSVVELNPVAARIAGVSNVFVVLEGTDTRLLRSFADRLVLRLPAIGPPWVTSAEDGIQAARDFLMPRGGLFLSKEELRSLKSEIAARYGRALDKSLGVALEEEEPEPIAERLEKRLRTPRWEALRRYPHGYFQSADGRAVIVVARTSIPSGNLTASREALDRIRAEVEAARTQEFNGLPVGYAGDLVTGLSEYGVIKDDLVKVGALGLTLILVVISLFFMRLRVLWIMALTIGTGLAWTFGLTQMAIGELNVVTGFLVSIVAGNGINFGIIYMARFLEEQRAGRSVEEALVIAHRTTWMATLIASLAAAAAYGTLGATAFRGFKHLAFIGAVGMIVCWMVTYAMTPALLALTDRIRPMKPLPPSELGSGSHWLQTLRAKGSRYDAPFTLLVFRAPRTLTVLGVLLAVVSASALFRYVKSDPIEYDMRRLQNDLSHSRELYRLSALARQVLGIETESAMMVLVDRLEQVLPLKRALEATRDAAPANQKPFEEVHTLFEYVAGDQESKIPDLETIRSRLARSRALKLISDSDWERVSLFLPPKNLRPYGIEDLPMDLARLFTEKDGVRGRVVLIEPAAGRDENDLRYLIQFADSFRETQLPGGDTIHGSGRAVILADMLKAVLSDIPKAVVMSLGTTVLAVLLMFGFHRHAFMVLGALLLGIVCLGGLLAALKLRINFFNFVALPITFGIGVDYAVNVVQRWAEGGSVKEAMGKTGGAVVLCSLTTTLGYLALTRSLNQAVRSLGEVAVLGEVCCLLAAMLVLPAALLWLERRRETRLRT